MRLGPVLLAALVIATAAAPAGAQATGRERARYEVGRAAVDFEQGAFAPQAMERFAGLLAKGIADIETYVDGALPADDASRSRIVYHVRSGLSMSRSFRRTVLLPAERVASDSAPYLHETTHVLYAPQNDCMWLSEGFASYVQSYVAEHIGGYDGYVFSVGGNRNVDRLARRYLASENGRAVLPYVGSTGSPPEVWEERRQVAAPFYVLSHSLVKRIVETAGIRAVKRLVLAKDVAGEMEAATGRSAELWKRDWLASVSPGHAAVR